jgi:hypothetical protein
MGLYTAKKYDFKSHGCGEVASFDIPLAMKEYIQNTQGQILKALDVRKWRDWERLDMSDDSAENFDKRGKIKAKFMNSDPRLFAGGQGKAIAKSKLCKTRYVLEATIPLNEIRAEPRDHDFRAVLILWAFKIVPTGPDCAKAITVYKAYLDRTAKFSHFVHGGPSTSKDRKWAVGLKRKGFILSTSYLAQVCQDFKESCDNLAWSAGRPVNDIFKEMLDMSSEPIGVGFNVGSRLYKAEYNKTDQRMLKVQKRDLRPLKVESFRDESEYQSLFPISAFIRSWHNYLWFRP